MFQAFFTGLSGLFSFSKNLDTVSNNIANMNTPGYRGQDTFYRSLGGNDGTGVGTQVSGLGYRFAAGDQTQTNNPLDMAIAGNGFFVLLDGDELRYTRAGRFEFKDNVMVDSATGLEVAQYTADGEIKTFDISSYQTALHETTTQVNFSGNLSTIDTDGEHKINDITVYNQLGEAVTLNLTFTRDGTQNTKWKITGTDGDGNTLVINNDEIVFSGDGPSVGFETASTTILDSQGNLTQLTFNFGGTDNVDKATSNALGADSTLQHNVQDGKPTGTLESYSFNADGTIKLVYDNGAEKTGPGIALANFSNDDVLELVEGSIFKANNASSREMGRPESGSLGSLATGVLELSNVDLSREFADMIIVQRGYQASSRVLNIANQMLEQLYDSTRGR